MELLNVLPWYTSIVGKRLNVVALQVIPAGWMRNVSRTTNSSVTVQGNFWGPRPTTSIGKLMSRVLIALN